jgi:Recombinase
VKLWQFDPADRTSCRIDTSPRQYTPVKDRPGVENLALFADKVENVRLERWVPRANIELDLPGGGEFLVLEGGFKHRKELVINGKDYVKNPENHFTLIVLGAVAELERAKIIERATRGKQLRLMQGQLLGCGNTTFGCDFFRRTRTSPPRMVVNEGEAAIVRFVFETYASGDIGLDRIAQQLEDRGFATKTGKRLWRRSFLKAMLHRETYLGIKYFNTVRFEREYATPLSDIKHSTVKRSPRGREEWIGIKVPAIISRELFERVQDRLKKRHIAIRGTPHSSPISFSAEPAVATSSSSAAG